MIDAPCYNGAMSRNIKLIIAFDGTDFHGWQNQSGLRTVQNEIEQVLQRVVREPVHLTASSRTDAGVHALGLVANFHTQRDWPIEKIFRALNSRLPGDVTIVEARDVPEHFHATRHARSKIYRYRLDPHPLRPVRRLQQRYVYHYPRHPLDVERMQRATEFFIGMHDFRSFCGAGQQEKINYTRTILHNRVYREDDEIRYEVCGTGFLYNQVRNMVGTLLEIGRSHWPVDCLPEILAAQDRRRAGPTAPPQGLCLISADYPPDDQLPIRNDLTSGAGRTIIE
ncbi:MAG: tRNA pseudouridine synthase A [Phycisphaerae bacterium]|nr:tRNA pseudouridine synthase A [Phycisphaerae bacterium]